MWSFDVSPNVRGVSMDLANSRVERKSMLLDEFKKIYMLKKNQIKSNKKTISENTKINQERNVKG